MLSSNEPGELLQWPCHDDSTINMVTGISINIIRPHRGLLLLTEWHGLSVCLSVCHTSEPCKNG